MPELFRIKENGRTLKGLRGVDRRTCELMGGEFHKIGNESVCFVEEEEKGDAKVVKKPNLEIVDVKGEESIE